MHEPTARLLIARAMSRFPLAASAAPAEGGIRSGWDGITEVWGGSGGGHFVDIVGAHNTLAPTSWVSLPVSPDAPNIFLHDMY